MPGSISLLILYGGIHADGVVTMFSPHRVGSSYYALTRGALWLSCGFVAAFLQQIIVDTASQCRDTEYTATYWHVPLKEKPSKDNPTAQQQRTLLQRAPVKTAHRQIQC
jgi:hypothetical protein